MSTIKVVTQDITQLTDQIYRVRLAAYAGTLFDFRGGQYLFLLLPDGKRIPLSIASSPEETQFIELHIRLVAGGGIVEDMLNLFRSEAPFEIDGPYGNCFLKAGEAPVIIIAGGTGLSPMKSMLESAFACGDQREFKLFLGTQKSSELYQGDLLNQLAEQNSNFEYIPVVNDPETSWQGKCGFPHEVALNSLGEKAKSCEFYVGGSEAMVMNVYQALLDYGVPPKSVYSDILDIKRESGEVL
ncbi:hypothetical protein FLL45_21640 [Aliikangiella marina]|uniref:FAD-binding FR-type domain-containing protein n=1 Tax=Aliikangiella marina TaxID=1712262 RepID=A0A545T141_9GAMM|nr:FAD-binding oxidoreductase [Aliikangiella marina]TQV70933.1 hypothetical protein FLL45_21640 [Aliikangiella marina]